MSKKKLTSVKVVVSGSGKIPRMNMLAPINTPFDVDLNTLNAIMKAPGLTVSVVSPIDKHKVPINRQNIEKIKKLYAGWLMMADSVEAEEIEKAEKIKQENTATEEDERILNYVKSKNPTLASAAPLTKSAIDKAIDGAFEKSYGKEITPPPTKEEKNPNSPIKQVSSVAIKEDKE